jgi:hypothetical protein
MHLWQVTLVLLLLKLGCSTACGRSRMGRVTPAKPALHSPSLSVINVFALNMSVVAVGLRSGKRSAADHVPTATAEKTATLIILCQAQNVLNCATRF